MAHALLGHVFFCVDNPHIPCLHVVLYLYMDIEKITKLRADHKNLVVEHQRLKLQYDHLSSLFAELSGKKIKEFVLHESDGDKQKFTTHP
jgi:hypothetical protein